MQLGSTPELAIPYENESDIYTFLERTYGVASNINFYGVTPDSYFILTEQTLREPKTLQDYRVIYIEDSKNQRHKIFFKKVLI